MGKRSKKRCSAAGATAASKCCPSPASKNCSGDSGCDFIRVDYDTAEAATLPDEERMFLRRVSLQWPRADGKHRNKKAQDSIEAQLVERAVEILEKHHMVIIHNVLSEAEVAEVRKEYESLLDFSGDSAVGEKDATKRSGTRFYNCHCQVGPNCPWQGWKSGSEQSRSVLHRSNGPLRTWEKITRHFKFVHIARVEVVTSHKGCRNQGWHEDAAHGLTVIFPLAPVDLRKGPTQMDFSFPFNNLKEHSGKVGGKKRDMSAPKMARAAMPCGSVVLFNANMSHRGTANLTNSDRPILVLDCSLRCEHEAASIWDL